MPALGVFSGPHRGFARRVLHTGFRCGRDSPSNFEDLMTKAAIYVRVSSEEQARDGDSLEAQMVKLQAYCRSRTLDVVAELAEPGVSAGKPLAKRAQGQKLLELVKSKQVDAVVVWSLDRAFRKTSECLVTVEDWTRREVALHLFNFGGQAIDTSSAIGKLFLTVIAGVAEFERNVNGERTALAMRHKIGKREYIGGEARYGWRVVERDPAVVGSGRLVEVPEEQAVIARAVALRTEGLSTYRIASTLSNERILARNGRPFRDTQIERMLGKAK